MLAIHYILESELDASWGLISEALSKIPDIDLDDVRASIEAGQRRVLVVYHTEMQEVMCVAVVQLTYTPRPMLLVHALSGERLNTWAAALNEALVNYARELGVSVIRGYGRRGWAKPLKSLGWHEVSTVYEMEIEHG